VPLGNFSRKFDSKYITEVTKYSNIFLLLIREVNNHVNKNMM